MFFSELLVLLELTFFLTTLVTTFLGDPGGGLFFFSGLLDGLLAGLRELLMLILETWQVK